MSVSEMKTIAAWVKDPREPGLFYKPKKSDRAECRTIQCRQSDCPLLKARQCVIVRAFGCNCPYGKYSVESGPTGRSGSIYQWLQDRREKFKGVEWMESPPDKMAFIGEHVYLPYAHMSMCKEVPFLSHSLAFFNGTPFIKRSNWTIETVLTLIMSRPQALFGGEIPDYQRKSVPAFIAHIRELDPDMWQQLIAVHPHYNVAPNYIGRKALVKTLASPIDIPAYDARYPVRWHWDGEKLTTHDESAYGSTWGHIKGKKFEMTIVPADDATIEVKNNAWVTPETVFAD